MSSHFLNELEVNATTAALIERAARLTNAVRRLEQQPATEDRDFALAANRQAHRHTVMALRTIAGGLADEAAPAGTAYPEPAAGWQENELRVMAGDR